MSTFGERLRFLRKLHCKTQAELGQMIGTSKTSIHNYEAGRTTPSTPKIVELARILNVNTDYLLGTSDRMHDAKEPYIVHKKFPLISRDDAKNLPAYIVTAARGYIEAPVEDNVDAFAVELEKNGVAFTVIVKRGKRDAAFSLCEINGHLAVLPREKAITLTNPGCIIGGVLHFV